jgi:hypothetical protein
MDTSPHELWNLSWKDLDIDSSLTVLRRYVESEAQRQIAWYFGKMRLKSLASTTLRFVAIGFFVVGALVPVLKATLTPEIVKKLPVDFAEAGYLLIGIAGGCIALDRFFGYSSGWIRCMTTALALDKSLEEFRMEWARNLARLRGGPPTEAQLDQLLLTCETFSLAIRSQVEQETKAWVIEFRSNMAQLERDLESKVAEVKARKSGV